MMMEDKKKYNILDQKLSELNQTYVTPDEKKRTIYTNDLNQFLEKFRSALRKTDPFFEKHREIIYTGSVYDDLSAGKICKEFDLDFLIKLDNYGVSVENGIPGYVSIQITDRARLIQSREIATIKNWLDDDDYISPQKFLWWGKGVVVKTINSMHGSDYELKEKDGGPAYTINVKNVLNGITYDVDIVFAIRIRGAWPFSFDKSDEKWIAVAKWPLKKKPTKHWRYSLHTEELKLLSPPGGNYHLKTVIRMIKFVRKEHELTFISSYYIKTLCLIDLRDNGPTDWKNDSLSWHFVRMLKQLKSALAQEYLPFYWEYNHNLLDKLTRNQLNKGEEMLGSILKNIEKWTSSGDVNKLETLFVRKPKNDVEKMIEENGFKEEPVKKSDCNCLIL